MDVQSFDIKGPLLITPRVFGDRRGWFTESFHAARFREATGQDVDFCQDNHSYSAEVGTVRGLHYQSPPHAQSKLVRCTRGALIDIIVDARTGSTTYGQHIRVELTAENHTQFYVPKGFIHGFATLVPDTEIQYKVDDYYAPDCDGSVRWDSLDLDWGVPSGQAIVSDKDRDAPAFADWRSPF